MKFRYSKTPKSYKGKTKKELNKAVRRDSNSMISNPVCESLKEFAESIEAGYIFTPAEFKPDADSRSIDNVYQMQLFALDFDGDGSGCVLKYEDALRRAEKYMLPVVVSYETLSSVDMNRYRLVFLYNEPIYEKRLMILIIQLLLTVFPEADKAVSDISRLFYPGRNVHLHGEDMFYFDSLMFAAMNETEQRCTCPNSRPWRPVADRLRKKCGVVTVGTYIKTTPENIYAENCTYSSVSVNIYSGRELRGQKTPFFNTQDDSVADNTDYSRLYIYFTDDRRKQKEDRPNSKDSVYYIKDYDYNRSERDCRLLHEFISGERRLEHNEWFGVMTNLIHINKGQTIFEDTIYKYEDMYEKFSEKLMQMSYAVNNGYRPAGCSSFCPYASECRHKANIVCTIGNMQSGHYRVKEQIDYIPLEEARTRCYKAISDAVYDNNDITVIKTQTGVGKSYSALRLISNLSPESHPVIYALPTIELVNEKLEEAKKLGIQAMAVPSIQELYPYISSDKVAILKRLYNNGAYEMPLAQLREWSHEDPVIKQFLDNYCTALRYNGHLFSTHSRLLRLNDKTLENRVVIVDEDISTLLIPIKKITVDELKMLYMILQEYGDPLLTTKVYSVLQKVADGMVSSFSEEKVNMSAQDKNALISFVNSHSLSFANCFLGFLESGDYYYDSMHKEILFITKEHIPHFRKLIMLSATANETVCRSLFGTLNFVDIPQVKYLGAVIQDFDECYSRTYFQEDTDEKFADIMENHPDCAAITFMKYESNIQLPPHRKMHFGAALGTNRFEGQDIAVIGTPHLSDSVIKLTARALGCEKTNDKFTTRRIVRNGLSLCMMTYKNELLREIQLYMIESQLEQAIGRARLLSNDCTVYVYSRYPAMQFVMKEELETS